MRRYLAIVIAVGCVSRPTVAYSPEDDDDAMRAIASTWSAGTGMVVSLCEDRTAPMDDTCEVEHVVRGGGLGRRHEETGTAGCGGCPRSIVAHVRGTVSGGGLGDMVEVVGGVGVGSNDAPYEFPYYVALECVDQTAPCTLSGTLAEDGRLELELSSTGSSAPTGMSTLERSAAASCP